MKPNIKQKKLVAVIAATRHDKAEAKMLGRWANENQYPLSLQGFANATRHGERFIELLKKNPRIWEQLKRRGLFYTGITSPLQRAVETSQANYLGLHAKLSEEGIKVQGHEVKNPGLEIVKVDKRFRQYPRTKTATKNLLQKLEDYSGRKKMKGFEPIQNLRQRMANIGGVADIFRSHAKELSRGSPVYFLNFVSHGGEKGIPLQIDYAVEALTGKKTQKEKALQRGQSAVQLLYSDGSRKNILMRK